MSKNDIYILDDVEIKRRPKRKAISIDDKEDGPHLNFDGKADLKINTFNVVIDRLYSELNKRSEDYFNLNEEFRFLNNLSSISIEDIRGKASILAKKYHTDIDDDFAEECVQFKNFVEGMFDDGREPHDNKTNKHSRNPLLDYLQLIREKQLTTLFPNLDTALRFILCMMTSNASGERSFSVLKRIKNFLRSSAELFKSLDFKDLIKDFSAEKARKVNV